MTPKMKHQKELDHLATVLARRFIQRWDLYSVQRDDGRYLCVHDKLSHNHILDHLAGAITLGAYVLSEESAGRYLVLDADSEPDWRRLIAISRSLEELDSVSYLERSRRGGHLWLFFNDAMPGSSIRRFGRGLMRFFQIDTIELFPKQGKLTGGPGSLIRLPFGIHRKSGRRYGFYLPSGSPLAESLRDQIRILEDAVPITKGVFERFAESADHRVSSPSSSTLSGSRQATNADIPDYELVKRSISVRDFVARYVDLASNGTGRCPFHDDDVPSFSVHDDGNFWKCFACDKSGSIIDFWMYYQDCDFKTAVDELTSMLLQHDKRDVVLQTEG